MSHWSSLILAGLIAFCVPSHAQVTVTRSLSVNKNVPDPAVAGNNPLRTGFTWSNAGLSSIESVAVTLNMSSPFSYDPINLNDLSGNIRHGQAGETIRSGSLFSIGEMTSLSQTFTQSGALDGPWLTSNYFRVDVTDNRGGGIAKLDSLLVAITGNAANSGTLNMGSGGVLAAAAEGTTSVGATVVSAASGQPATGLVADADRVLNLSGGISGVGDFSKTGAGTVRVGNSTNFTGRLDVGAGRLVVDGALGSGSTTVVGSGGTLGGTGTVGALQVASGGILAVGNSPGQLNAGNTTWAGGASLAWEVDDSTGNETSGGNPLAGKGANWDFLNVTGTLNITATSTNKFIIDVISLLNDTNSGGSAGGFNPGTAYTFAIATASGGIQIGGTGIGSYVGGESAFNSALLALFDINTTAFSNNPGSDALWSISTSSGGTNLLLSYSGTPIPPTGGGGGGGGFGGGGGGATAIPEPSSASMLVLGLAALLAQRRRAKRG